MAKFRLHCDVCGYSEPVLHLVPELIGKECACCTHPMLTERDYRAAKRLLKVLPVLEALGLAKRQVGTSLTVSEGHFS